MPETGSDYTDVVSQHVAESTTHSSGSITASTEAVVPLAHEREDLSVFFGIGIVVNLTMFTLLVIWGYRQWKKHDEHKK